MPGPSPELADGVGSTLPAESIDFTDGLVVLALGLVVFWAIDPFALQLWRHQLTRHIPTAIAVIATLLSVAGRLLFPRGTGPQLHAVIRTYRELIFFAIFVIAGSLYAKLALGIESSFLAMGVFLILGGPVNLWIIRTSGAPLALVRSITIAIVGVSLLAVAVAAVRFGAVTYHSLENVVLAAVALPLLAGRTLVVRAAGAGLVVLAAVAPNKITGHIVMLLIFGWICVDALMTSTARDPDRVRAGLRRRLGALLAVLGAIAVIAVYEATKSSLPDGNLAYRTHTYQMALNRFLDSWLWGRGFAAPAVDYFDLFVVNTSTQYLPTHSDPLDILANGGLLAALPFALGLLSILRSAWRALRADWSPSEPGHGAARAQLAMYFLIMVGGVSVMAFNPILNITTVAYLYWTCSALMCALVPAAGAAAPAASGAPATSGPLEVSLP